MSKWNLDAKPTSLLTISGNPKLDKSGKHGYWTAALHLAPHKASGAMNSCAFASAGCAAACLNLAGRGGMALDADGLNSVQVARIQRTRWLKRDRAGFLVQLRKEIAAHIRRAERAGMKAAIRPNATSDLTWERWGIIEEFPDTDWYDYTAWPVHLRQNLPENYSLTMSLKEDNDEAAFAALEAGRNVAVVMDVPTGIGFGKKGALPTVWTFMGQEYPVIDGDEHDLRFLDSKGHDGRGVIVGLRAKGSRKMRREGIESGFVREPFPLSA